MRRYCRNTSVLILTCLIWSLDESQMTHLFSAIGCNQVFSFRHCMDTLAHTCPGTSLCCLPTAYFSREKLVRSSPSYRSSSRRRKVRPSLMPTPAPSCFTAALLVELFFHAVKIMRTGQGIGIGGGQVFFVFPARY
jgi:hypothetical protein